MKNVQGDVQMDYSWWFGSREAYETILRELDNQLMRLTAGDAHRWHVFAVRGYVTAKLDRVNKILGDREYGDD